ncbi:hypothetical protein WJX72_012113 [[Myrmecia] bisecta]|uniref:Uncharacterized protein n=1 Tax=[Myrmecia] bisecta TaxID=41462 RepID=A0AAW1RAC1_9CHLO
MPSTPASGSPWDTAGAATPSTRSSEAQSESLVAWTAEDDAIFADAASPCGTPACCVDSRAAWKHAAFEVIVNASCAADGKVLMKGLERSSSLRVPVKRLYKVASKVVASMIRRL